MNRHIRSYINKPVYLSLAIFSASIAMLSSSAIFAETVVIPVGSQAMDSTINVPHRGLSSSQVLERFGSPNEKQTAIGTPPITIWYYPSFSVYFESGIVIHSVKHK